MRIERSEFIQISRFVAAFLVVVTHTTFYASERLNRSINVWHFGEIGVPLFFCISGFVMVISVSKLPHTAAGAQTFLIRRFVRIVPLYWLATALKIGIAITAPGVVAHNHFDEMGAVKSFLFVPYFNAAGEVRPMHGVGWTLLHEVFFYLVFASALMARQKPVIWTAGIISLLCFVGMFVSDKSAPVQVATSPVNLYFVIGMVVAWAMERSLSATWSVALLVVLSLAVWVPLGMGGLMVVAFAALILWLADHNFSPTWRRVTALGDSSYSLYLFHPFAAPAFVILFGRYLQLGPEFVVVLTCLLTAATCHALHLILERPVVQHLRDRLRPLELAGHGK